MSRKAAVNYKDFIEFAKFLDDWSSELTKAEFSTILSTPYIAQAATEYIAEKIEDATQGNAFAMFMANRTYVEARPTARGITFEIKGYSEAQMRDMGREHRLSASAQEAGKDYNLWEMYEHGTGGGLSTKTMPTVGGKQRIQKDVGGPIVIRDSTGGTQELKGRRGLIGALLPQIRSQLMYLLKDIIEDGGALSIAYAQKAAARGKKIKGLAGNANREAAKQAAKLDIDVAKLGNVVVSSGGTLREQGKGGRFIKSPVSSIRVSVKK